ncbi:MAG: hypothetical protein GY842_13180, partial [bacterium]|nr:hypothetical protein [bacterium]
QERIDTVWERVDRAERFARDMLDGGSGARAIRVPIQDPDLRSRAERVLEGGRGHVLPR